MPIKEILKSIPLFKSLDKADLELIASHLHKERYPKGAIVFREGDVGDTMYLVESGRVAVVGQEATDTIAIMGPGSFVGEISLLLAKPRTANLQVMIDAELWVLHRTEFEQLIATRPSIALEMMRELSQRLVTTTRRQRRPMVRRITALFGDYGLELAQALYSQFKAAIGLLPLPKARVSGDITLSGGVMLLSSRDLTEASLAEQLSHQVQVFKHIVLILPYQPDPLARKAVDLADTIVSIGQIPDWVAAGDGDQDKDVWVFPEEEVDLFSVARRLTNRSVGLALSSGGSRGLAHIGVLKVLLEEKIPVDMVAGTSAGAWFGAFFAAGWDAARYDQFVDEIHSVTKFSNWDFNIPPRTGIAKGRKARDRVIGESIDHRHFEDLEIPMCMVAADIFSGEEVIFDSGPLADAIRASLSVPVLADPWYYEGHYLVDGGIVNPLPASVLRERGADIVIASSVIQPMRDSYGGRRDKMPNILQIVFNMFSAMEAEVVEKQLPLIDVLIQHHVSAKHTLDFEQVAEVVRLGERTAREMLPTIKKTIEAPPE